jgi:hypothetical protein
MAGTLGRGSGLSIGEALTPSTRLTFPQFVCACFYAVSPTVLRRAVGAVSGRYRAGALGCEGDSDRVPDWHCE